MTTATTTTASILAIDLGRYKSVACVYDRATRAAAFRTLDSTRAAFARLFAGHPGAVVVVEACATAGWRPGWEISISPGPSEKWIVCTRPLPSRQVTSPFNLPSNMPRMVVVPAVVTSRCFPFLRG